MKPGDVLEIPIKGGGSGYAQYTHKAPIGEVIRVFPGVHSCRPANFTELVRGQEQFHAVVPLPLALREGIFTVAAHVDVPNRARQFPRMRVRGAVDSDGFTKTWYEWDGTRERRIWRLTPELARLSVGSVVVDLDVIGERIASGYSPAEDIGRPRGILSRRQRSPIQQVEHYLYFPSADAAGHAAGQLSAAGFDTETPPAPDESNWPVVVRTAGEPSLVRTELERVAEHLGGEYDGWGAAV
ncbi:MAG TPA: ribonuclease E inhibitor RraB [Acidimicrobiales bacterium]|nr:ribonuclease E inhibitor RraB [Acidimicrobiales bacterium]